MVLVVFHKINAGNSNDSERAIRVSKFLMPETPLRCLFIGVRPRSRGSKLLHMLSRHFPEYLPVGFVDASRELALEQVNIEPSGKEGGWKNSAVFNEGKWKEMPCFGCLEEALAGVAADAAVISSPAKFHGEQIRLCLEAGLHAFVAKPLTYDLDEAERLVQMAERKQRCLVVDQQFRFSLTERTVADWVRDGRYGRVGYIDVSIHRYRPTMGSFTGDNPFLWEQAVHTFNSLVSILGVPAVRVFARQSRPAWSSYNGPTMSVGLIEFEGGILCDFMGSFESRSFTMEMRFECERAAFRLVSQNSFGKELEIAEPGAVFVPAGVTDFSENEPSESFNFEAFLTGCRGGGRVPNDGRDNLRTLAIVDAFIRSAESGQSESVRQF